MRLWALAEKTAHADVLREMIGMTYEQPMNLEVTGMTGAANVEMGPEQLAQHDSMPRARSANCCDWHRQLRAGTVELGVPTPSTGSGFSGFLEPSRMTEKALTTVIEEAPVQGISTRAVDDLVQVAVPAFVAKMRKTIGLRRTWNGIYAVVTVHS